MSVWSGSLVLGTLGLALLVAGLHVPQIPAQFVRAVVISVVSFFAHRVF